MVVLLLSSFWEAFFSVVGAPGDGRDGLFGFSLCFSFWALFFMFLYCSVLFAWLFSKSLLNCEVSLMNVNLQKKKKSFIVTNKKKRLKESLCMILL